MSETPHDKASAVERWKGLRDQNDGHLKLFLHPSQLKAVREAGLVVPDSRPGEWLDSVPRVEIVLIPRTLPKVSQ